MNEVRTLIAEDEAVTAADLEDELTAQGYDMIEVWPACY
jgi:AmiR/NasT family two-component response regulator